ncbi:MAG: fumarylacetoacetase [Acidibrevibacterium sp.]|uniref:fumarylacetoacetase n=1 Tax=Acidibrevibacterium sp. TaxID=2606776 RepID=UPI003CFCBC57
MIDATHDQGLRSWVASANGHSEFPIQNLPLGVFSRPGGEARIGVAIGDKIFDLRAAAEAGAIGPAIAPACREPVLNALLGESAAARTELRQTLSELLQERAKPRPEWLHATADCVLHLPARIGDYTDFFAGIHHATNTGRQFRPDNPLLANYKYVPVAYHGRASSVVVSGHEVRRPNGQRKPSAEMVPSFGASRNLDYELELGIWVGPGNALGEPITIAEAADHIAGFSLLNDWSARDIQGWEYQPLGPFLAKNFATTISPWIVTTEALAPFRIPQAPRPAGDPAPLAYLSDPRDQANGAFAIVLEVLLQTPAMRAAGQAPQPLAQSNTRYLYWTVAQMLAHHASNGCNLSPGDLFGSGTISGPSPESYGSLLEITEGGRKPLTLPSGETRRFLEDGDEVIFRAHATREGFARIGFGECRGVILPAPASGGSLRE